MERITDVARILLSTGISLAEEIGCFADPSDVPHAKRRPQDSVDCLDWAHTLCTFLRITDESLSLRLRLEPQLRSLRLLEIADCVSPALAADEFWESTVDLATQMGKARDLLRSWRKSQHGTGPAIPLAAWDSFRRSLDRWKRQRQLNRRGALDSWVQPLQKSCIKPPTQMFPYVMPVSILNTIMSAYVG